MRPKLTVVVACTGRKSAPATRECLVRHLPGLSLAERHDIWRHRLDENLDKMPVNDLYAGDAWRRTEAVLAAAASAGFEPTLFVASAGLGLVEASTLAPAYGATFTTGHADSVADSVTGKRDWWSQFSVAKGNTLQHLSGDATIVVLSEAYASALDDDLTQLAATSGDHLLVGGSREVPGLTCLRSDLGLRHKLGGTAVSLNLRMAERWLGRLGEPKLTDKLTMERWMTWADGVRHTEHYDRQRMTDAQVLDFIRSLRSQQVAVSRTRALQILRASDLACEQTRFAKLFAEGVTA